MKVSLEILEMRKLMTATATPVAYTLGAPGSTAVSFEPIIPIYLAVPKVTAHLTHTGTLMIQGTAGKDDITVLPTDVVTTSKSGDKTIDTVEPSITVQNVSGATFKASDVKRIVVDAGSGNDNVVISSSIKVNTTLVGGNGNDTLVGGGGSDLISGGKGNDKLFAASTVIVGADGSSTVYGTINAASAIYPGTASAAGQLKLASAAAETSTVYYTGSIVNATSGQLKLAAAPNAITIYYTAGGNLTAVPDTQLQIAATPKTSTIYESGKTADSLEGGAGDDMLYAGNGSDTVNGGNGNDTLVTVGRGTTPPLPIIFRRGDDARSFDGVTLFSIEAINPM